MEIQIIPFSILSIYDDLRVYDNILETIFKTPLVRLNRVARSAGCPIFAKMEFLNPGCSVKDRIGTNMIVEAESSSRLKPSGTMAESTFGNTGVGLEIS
jgi:cysteine synthase